MLQFHSFVLVHDALPASLAPSVPSVFPLTVNSAPLLHSHWHLPTIEICQLFGGVAYLFSSVIYAKEGKIQDRENKW